MSLHSHFSKGASSETYSIVVVLVYGPRGILAVFGIFWHILGNWPVRACLDLGSGNPVFGRSWRPWDIPFRVSFRTPGKPCSSPVWEAVREAGSEAVRRPVRGPVRDLFPDPRETLFRPGLGGGPGGRFRGFPEGSSRDLCGPRYTGVLGGVKIARRPLS